MSSYTTELRYICESLIGLDKSVGFNNTLLTIEQARPLLFDFNYPIFNIGYKPILETNFILHFYTREIGLETFGLWKLKLMSMFRIKMPYYNKIYEAINTEFNPLYDINVEKTFMGDIKASIKQDLISNEKINTLTTQERQSVNDETQNNNSVNWDLFQDTPQGALVGVENQNYLTNARKQTDDSSVGTVFKKVYGDFPYYEGIQDTGSEMGFSRISDICKQCGLCSECDGSVGLSSMEL